MPNDRRARIRRERLLDEQFLTPAPQIAGRDVGDARLGLVIADWLYALFPAEPEIMGLTALLLLQHARTAARFDAEGAFVLLDDQDRSLWDREMIGEGVALDQPIEGFHPGDDCSDDGVTAVQVRLR